MPNFRRGDSMPEGEGNHAVNPNDPYTSSTRATRGTWPQPTVKEGDPHHAPPPEPAAAAAPTTKRKNRITLFGKKNKSSPTRPPSEESGLTRKTKPAMAPRQNSAANRNGLFRDPREEALALGMDPIPPPTTASSTPGGNKHKKSSRKQSRSISQSDSDHPNNNNHHHHHHHGHGTGGNNNNSDRRSSISDARQNSAINTESLARDPRAEMKAAQRRAQVMAQQKNDTNSHTNDESSRPGRNNGLGRVNEENDYLEESNNGHGNGNGGCAVGTSTTTKERERLKPSHSLLANYMIEDVSTLHLEDNSESPTSANNNNNNLEDCGSVDRLLSSSVGAFRGTTVSEHERRREMLYHRKMSESFGSEKEQQQQQQRTNNTKTTTYGSARSKSDISDERRRASCETTSENNGASSSASSSRGRRNTIANSGSSSVQSLNNNHFHEEEEEEEEDDDEPIILTRPSQPTIHTRRRGYPHRHNAFDVTQTRASLMSRLQQEPKSKRFVQRMAKSSRGSGVVVLSSPQENDFRSSLKDCLGDMGFEDEEVDRAIEETNARSSEDAAKVVEWLGDSERRCGGNGGGGGGGGLDRTRGVGVNKSTSEDQSDDDDEDDAQTHNTKASHFSTATNETQESNPDVLELKESLKNLGYTEADIKRHKEIYRRHSDKMKSQEFIAAMLEMEDEDIQPQQDNRKRGGASASSDDNANASSSKLSAQNESLVGSISEMGFEIDQVTNVIHEMEKSGSSLDVESILGVLLSSGGGGGEGSSPKNDPSKSMAKQASFNEIDTRQSSSHQPSYGSNNRRRNNRSTLALSRGLHTEEIQYEAEEKSMSIEITPGQFAQLLKGRRTWNAMHNGSAISESCIICTTTLQCCPEADYVLCPDCNVVSPLTKKSSRRSNDDDDEHVGAVGLGYKKD